MHRPDVRESLLYIHTEDGFNGYRRELLITQLTPIEESYLVCIHCKGIMREACSTNEGLLQVCFLCIENQEGPYQNLVSARKSVLELNVKCPLSDRKCGWKGKMCDISQHLDECVCYIIECSLDCGDIIQRGNALLHQTTDCPMKPIKCEFCNNRFSPILLIDHEEECKNTPIICSNQCGMQVKKADIDYHLKSECPNSLSPCSFDQYGCSATQMKRESLKEHMRSNNELHTALLSEYIATTQTAVLERISQLESAERDRSKQMEELSKQNNKLSNKVRHLNDIIMTSLVGTLLRWRIVGFASDTNYYESPALVIEGYTLKCNISLEDAKLQVKLSTIKGPGDKNAKWPFKGKSIVLLVNQDRENESLYFEGEDVELVRNFYDNLGDSINHNKRVCSIPIASVIRDPFCKKGVVSLYVLVKAIA